MVQKPTMLISFLLLTLSFISLACAVTRNTPATGLIPYETLLPEAVVQTISSPPLPSPSLTPGFAISPTSEYPTATPESTLLPATPLQALYTDQSNNLWLWQDGSSTPRQLDDSAVVKYGLLSDDGSQAAYVRMPEFSQYSIWLINTDGTDKKELVSYTQLLEISASPGSCTECTTPWDLQWLPGRKVLSFTMAWAGRGIAISGEIFQVDAASGALTKVISKSHGGFAYYSPDGKYMAAVSSEVIHLVDMKNTQSIQTMLSYPQVITLSDMEYYPQIRWSADSNSFMTIIIGKDQPSWESIDAQIWQVAIDGSQPVQVGKLDDVSGFSWDLSPVSSYVVYQKWSGTAQNPVNELHFASVDGTNDKLIQSAWFISHHPDSNHFIFFLDRPTNCQLAQLDGTYAPLTDTGYAKSIKWASKDTFLFFNSTGNTWQLRRQTLGSPSTVLDEFTGTEGFDPYIDLSGGLE